jgi:hypothetical protein
MPWDTRELLLRFNKPQNKNVIHYLIAEHPSAHSDCTEELFLASHYISNRQSFCPKPQAYAYIFLHTTDNIIYALAVGMNTLTFRLPPTVRTEALGNGGTLFHGLSDEWISFEAFHLDKPLSEARAAMARWCRHAHDFAVTQNA